MTDIECDDCGSLNPEGADQCELCGASLEEEKARKVRRKNLLLAPLAWGTAAVLLFGVIYISSAWWLARMQRPLHRRPSSMDLFSILNDSAGIALASGVVTLLVLGGVFVAKVWRSGDE